MAFGPQTGLDLIDKLTEEPALENYHLLPTVRGDLLSKVGRLEEARAEFERAATLTRNGRERALLLDRARALTPEGLRPQASGPRAGPGQGPQV
jgi:predicted RNA polymerase sigma factor